MKPKICKKRRRGGLNIPIGNSRETMGIRSVDCLDIRKNYFIKNLSQRWGIPFPMLSPMGGQTLNMMIIRSIGCREISVCLCFCLARNYRTSWLGTCKVRNGILLEGLVSWNNHVLNKMWGRSSTFFTPINFIVIVSSQRRWQSTYLSDSTTWRKISSSVDKTIFTPRIILLESYK